jgi:type IV secretory pathway VirD2 relaxase
MSKDDYFIPKLGRIRSKSGGVSDGRSFLNRILKASNMARGAGPRPLAKPATSRFTGSRIGRGNGAGRVLSLRAGVADYHQRRVLVKSRIVRLAGKGYAAAVAHMRYLQRDGVTREGLPGELYSAQLDRADGREFVSRCEGDRHQFRFIVSPEDGVQYDSLKAVTRRLMDRMEEDLGTKLDWVAVDHYNTGHPHTHILIRGKDDLGKDLILAREYITSGVRERAAEIVSLDLGPRTQWEIDTSLQAEVTHERFTRIDRQLIQDQTPEGIVRAVNPDAFQQSLFAGRLHTLKNLGLAKQVGPAEWQLSDNLEPVLKALGQRGDIIKILNRDLKEVGRAAALTDFVLHDRNPSQYEGREQPAKVTGALIRRSLSDELEDRHNVTIDGIDGHVHVVDIGQGERTPHIPENAVITVEFKVPSLKKSDVTIADIANANGGFYSVATHLQHDRSAGQSFAETHVRRLEAIKRATGKIERTPDGRFIITPDYPKIALDYERSQAKLAPVKVEVNSSLSLSKQSRHNGMTWLDRELTSSHPSLLANAGFGAAVTDALKQRQGWLIEQGLAAWQSNDTINYSHDMNQVLAQREMRQVAGQLSKELGLNFMEVRQWQQVEGKLRQVIDTASGKYGLIERAKDFTLVPWRKELDRHIGKDISGMDHGSGFNWRIGRDLGLER